MVALKWNMIGSQSIEIVLVSVSTVEKKCCEEKTPIEIFRKIEVKNNKLQLDEQLNEFAFF